MTRERGPVLDAIRRDRRWIGGSMIVGAALVAYGAFSEQLGTMSVVSNIFLFIVLAQGWNLLGGLGGYLNLGMGGFFGVGIYSAAMLQYHLGVDPWFSAVIAGIVTATVAGAVGIPSLRLRGAYFAILTLIVTFLFRIVVFNWSLARGALGIFLEPLEASPRGRSQLFYFVFFALAVCSVLVGFLVENSRIGRALVAIREDEDAAEILGIRTMRTKMIALLTGGLMAGVAGGVQAYSLSYVEPEGSFGVFVSIVVVLMAVIGGSGAWQAPLIGVPLVIGLSEALRVTATRLDVFGGTGVPSSFNRVLLGLVLLGIALFAPRGIMGWLRKDDTVDLTV